MILRKYDRGAQIVFILDHRAQVLRPVDRAFLSGHIGLPKLLWSLATRRKTFLMLMNGVFKVFPGLVSPDVFQGKLVILVIIRVQSFQIFLLQLKSLHQRSFTHFGRGLLHKLVHIDSEVGEVERRCRGLDSGLRLHHVHFLHHFDPLSLLHGFWRSFLTLSLLVPNVQLVPQRLNPFLV